MSKKIIRQNIALLPNRLQDMGDPKVKDWWEKYLKHVIPFRGIKTPILRPVLQQWWKTEVATQNLTLQKETAYALFESKWSEDKLAGILAFENLAPQLQVTDLAYFERLFEKGLLYEWNNTDWLCVKVLHRLVQRGRPFAQPIAAWAERTDAPLWLRRAGVVSFVRVAKHGDAPPNFPGTLDLMLTAAAHTIQSSERFLQTGTGWLLREISVADRRRINDFIGAHIKHFTREGLQYTVEKFPKTAKQKALTHWKKAQ